MTPAGSPDSAVRAHFERVAPRYSSQRDGGFPGILRRREQAAILDLLQVRPGQRLLDAGCVDGAIPALASGLGARAVAADLVPAMARAARKRGVAAVATDLRALAFRSGFDAVAWIGSSEFVSDFPAAAREVARCLRPGGRLVLLVPRRNWFGLLLLLFHWRRGVQIHLRSRNEVSRGLSEAGFTEPGAWRRCAGAWACLVHLVGESVSRPS